MITLDCGIKANAAIAQANSYGIDVIICDHHLSCNWQQMTNADQPVLLQHCYEATQTHRGWVSPRGQDFIDFMVQDNLLAGYADWTNVERGLRSVLRRLNRMELAETLETFAPDWAQACTSECEALFNELAALVDEGQAVVQPAME